MESPITDLEKDLLESEERTNHCQKFTCHHWTQCPRLGQDVSDCRILSIPQSAQSATISVYSQSVFSDLVVSEREFEKSDDFYYADWTLVGHGVKHASCGSYWTKVCLEKHDPKELPVNVVHQKDLDEKCLADGVYVQRVKMSCHRPVCPECWTDWRKRQVARVKARFEAFEKDFNREERRHVKRCHGAISVPKKFWYWSQPKMKLQALKYLKELGIKGGTIIFHPKRERKQKKGVWYYSPHFHVYYNLWNGWIDGQKVDKWHKRTGWVFRNFGERILTKSISYQLSHAGVPPNHGHVVTWFGCMNYRLLHVEKWHGDVRRCPWGHVLDRYGVYVGKDKVVLPEKDGYSAYLPREGWVLLAKASKQKKHFESWDDG